MMVVLIIAIMNWPPWVVESPTARVQVMSVLFAAGLFIVAVEDVVGINKSAMMMVLAAVMWTFLAVGYHPNNSKAGYMQLHEELNRGLEEVGSVLLFLLPAMGVVESIDHFDGFALANMAIRRAIEGRKDRLMPIICILTFFLSSVIDNLTSTIVAVKILRRLASEDEEYRRLCGGLAVIAANAGGAWSPIGDVTTTMLWIQEKISATNTVLWLFLPSLAAGVLPLFGLRCQARRLMAEPSPTDHRVKDRKKGPGWEQEPLKESGLDEEDSDPITRQKVIALIFGVLCILMVPSLKMICGLPPYLGMLLALGLMWLLTDVLHFQGHVAGGESPGEDNHGGPPQLGVVSALRKVDLTGLLFFTGVLLAIGASWLHCTGESPALVSEVDDQTSDIDTARDCSLISDPADSVAAGPVYGDFGAGPTGCGYDAGGHPESCHAKYTLLERESGHGAGDRRVGVVKNWNHDRGFGFLRTEGQEKDTFFPRRELPPEFQGETALNGITFAYDVTAAADGRPQAKNLQFVGGAAQTIPTPSAGRGIEGFGTRCMGQVKSFSGKGGYGFISINTGADIFFAKRDLPVGMQEANLIGVQFEFDIGSSNDGRSQAKNLVCVDPGSANFGAVGPSGKGNGKGEPTEGSRLQGQIKEVSQDGGSIVCGVMAEEVPFTPTDLPANLQRQVLSGDTTRLQRATVLFTLAVGGGRAFAKEVMLIPEPDELIVGEVVQFNTSAGYGFIKPALDSVFQQDVYFNIKDLSRALSDEERGGLNGQTCRFNLRLTPDNRPQARRVEMVGAAFGGTRFSYDAPQVPAAPAGFAAGNVAAGVPRTRFSYEAPSAATTASGFQSGAPEPTFEATSRFSATPPGDMKRAAEGNDEALGSDAIFCSRQMASLHWGVTEMKRFGARASQQATGTEQRETYCFFFVWEEQEALVHNGFAVVSNGPVWMRNRYAEMINELCKHSAVRLSILLGLSSAVVDNVPLVEASIDMFRETKTDDPLWQLVALAAGTGGSVLSIGSIAGVTLMSMEHVGFIWYFRKVGVWAALGFFAGIGVYQLERLIITGGS
ncbi:NHD1 [Symbiodinium natans]|uniref:NHD1 protein n=1 Tax=Symbiodinium natans TaxID=878477 RepID=A0A812H5Q7_9DINO|nr:NHD1 [Symbiodinium natans]